MKNAADPKKASKEEWLAKLRAEGNKKLSNAVSPPPQEPAPTIFPDMIWVWTAFCFLSERRGVGANGPVPITVEAMDAYGRLTNRRERVYLEQLLQFVPPLDREYLKDFYDKQQAEIEKSRKQSERQAPRSGRRPAPQRRR